VISPIREYLSPLEIRLLLLLPAFIEMLVSGALQPMNSFLTDGIILINQIFDSAIFHGE
jgi:hypothetical protein